MIEEFIVKLEDGTEIRIAGELLNRKLPNEALEQLVSIIKSDTLEALLLKMSKQITYMNAEIHELQVENTEAKIENADN